MRYFTNCKTLEELRTEYTELLKKYHPDNGGDVSKCQEVIAEYKKAFEALKNNRKTAETKEEQARESKKWDADADEKIRKQIYNFIRFDGLNIEIIGCWVWIDGTTFPYREELKAKGFTWSKSRKKWHWTSEPATERRYYKAKKSFDEIRNTYGSEKVESESAYKLA